MLNKIEEKKRKSHDEFRFNAMISHNGKPGESFEFVDRKHPYQFDGGTTELIEQLKQKYPNCSYSYQTILSRKMDITSNAHIRDARDGNAVKREQNFALLRADTADFVSIGDQKDKCRKIMDKKDGW